MNGKQAKALRKALRHNRPQPAMEQGGLFQKDGRWYFQQRRVPAENLYRSLKRRFVRGEL